MNRSLWPLVWDRRSFVLTLMIGVVITMILHSNNPIVLESNGALADEGPMPDLGGAVSWLNSAPLNGQSLRGNVVLVNFWTYSCINSLRELPHIKYWAEKYKAAGLTVIGVHTPEFGFEEDRANVENAVSAHRIYFPVSIDSDRSISATVCPSFVAGEMDLNTSPQAQWEKPGKVPSARPCVPLPQPGAPKRI